MSLGRPTLIVHTTYFPETEPEGADDSERTGARGLGRDLYQLLTRPLDDRPDRKHAAALSWGAGIPVRVASRWDRVAPDEAEHVVVVPVLGREAHLSARVRDLAVAQIARWVAGGAHVIPVLRSPAWRHEEGRLAVKPLLTELFADGDRRAATCHELVLALARVLAEGDPRGAQIFISHAKDDLAATERAAEEIRDHIAHRTTGQRFFDTVSLLAGEDLAAQIDREAQHGVFVAVRSDQFSSRAWCMRELLQAKRLRLPTLTVEVLSRGEPRSSAYAGNGRTIVWQRGNAAAAAAQVVTAAMLECVQHRFFLAEGRRVIEAARLPEEAVVTLGRAPELLDLASLREGRQGALVVLHPDPELSVHERALLAEVDKHLRPATPTTIFSGALGQSLGAPLDGWQVALSLSATPDVDGPDGLIADHVDDATTFLARGLIAAGAAIAYGGDFRRNGFTPLLAQLAAIYNQTARKPAELLHSYLGVPIQIPDDWTLPFTAHRLARPEPGQTPAALASPAAGTALAPHRSALHFSDMRRVMAHDTRARVLLGGAAIPRGPDPGGYGGRYPGVVEEAWWTLVHGKPLYVAGGFGGAAALVVDVLEHDALPPRLHEATWNGDPTWDALVAGLDGDPDVATLGLPRTQEALADDLRRLGRPLLASDEAAIGWNGLTVEENRLLFRTRDPLTLAALVLKGLIACASRVPRGTLRVELVEGDIAAATGLDVIVFPTFADVPPAGAGASLDLVSGGAATRAHASGEPLAPAGSALGSNFVYAADLGGSNEATAAPRAAATRAAEATAVMANRHGFRRLGLVTFLGNVAASLGDVVTAMLAGLRGLPADAELAWFERDPARAALLAELLAAAGGVVLTRRVALPDAIPDAPRGRPRTIVSIRQDDHGTEAAVLVPEANGLVPRVRSPLGEVERRALAGHMLDPTPAAAELVTRGDRLTQLVFGDDARRLLAGIGDVELVILHDAESGGLPYEALGWGEAGARVTPATRGGIVRHLVAGVGADRALTRPPRAGRIGVLLVIDPRANLPSARAEGDEVLRLLTAHPHVQVRTTLRGGAATIAAVIAGLEDPLIDIVHYCGHAFYRGHGADESGLVCADGELTATVLRGVRRVPRLAFFNACQGGRVRGDTPGRDPQTFAELFLHAGVDAYLGTFWLVADREAAAFATEVYTQLGLGRELGEAVVRGRKALQDRGAPDWANYLLYGHAGFRLVRGAPAAASAATPVPPPAGRAEATTLVGRWSFSTSDAPETMAVAATELTADGERPVTTTEPIRVDRREGWAGTTAIVQWVATVTLAAPTDGRAFRLRATGGPPIDVGVPASTDGQTRAAAGALDELEQLRALLGQQPDRGHALLGKLLPSADPEEIRRALDAALDTRAAWPFSVLASPAVDDGALAAFVAAHALASITHDEAADQHFQTKEDWASYAVATGAIPFLLGREVNRPAWLDLEHPAQAMTYDVRAGEFGDDGLTVALFADHGNGLHAARAVASRIVAARLPYAFHLGDVYYGGTRQQFHDHFEAPLAPMLDDTELFMLAGNHEMFARGEWFQELVRRKALEHGARQRQCGEMFRLRGPGFQLIGFDTMFAGYRSGRMRLRDLPDDDGLALLHTWLDERPDDLTVLLTTNEPWDTGSRSLRPLYRALRRTIAGRVDLWFWGNVHYAALFEPWAFTDAGSPGRQLIGSCIGHGGYPFYTQQGNRELPDDVRCRWLETRSRFWPDARVRPDVGLNGWCRMKLARTAAEWNVTLTYVDWVGRDRLVADLVRPDGASLHLARVRESDIAAVGAPPTWRDVPPAIAR